jgi:hypothetical protein
VAEYEALVSMYTPIMARANGHTGVLTEQDVQSTKAGFPRPGDSKTLRDRKITMMQSLMGAGGKAGAGGPKKGDTRPITLKGTTYPGTEETFNGTSWVRTK